MTLHIFNPEHDIALASGLSNFTAPHAGRQLRHDLGFLPSLWAANDDAVLVDDIATAESAYRKLRVSVQRYGRTLPLKCHFVSSDKSLRELQHATLSPWGWDFALRALLLRRGMHAQLPSEAAVETIRQLSHRRTAVWLLPQLRIEGTVGESFECDSLEHVAQRTASYPKTILKAPWSSSGRGLRFVEHGKDTPNLTPWVHNLLAGQGSVMVEPYYNKVKDFGMEFMSDGKGRADYLGLSLFHTENGAYTGNILATEIVKRGYLTRYVSDLLLRSVQERICSILGTFFRDKYQGPFGVDMMVVANGDGFLLHPCVEINLRRTMGHVALTLSPEDDDIQRVMRIEYANDNYKLLIRKK